MLYIVQVTLVLLLSVAFQCVTVKAFCSNYIHTVDHRSNIANINALTTSLIKPTLLNKKCTNKYTFNEKSTNRTPSRIILQAFPTISTHFRSFIPTQNTVLVVSSIAILVCYHLNLLWKELSNSHSKPKPKTWRQYQADAREDWSKFVRETEGWLYAIQSLRNAITAQTFLASTVLSLLTLITGRIWDIIRCSTNQAERHVLTVQLVTIAMTMLVSAYQFLQGVRLMTHAGFMFPIKNNSSKVDKIMRETENCQWLGLRWMYLSLAPIAWTVGGSRAFFIVAIILLQFFRSIDKSPDVLGNTSHEVPIDASVNQLVVK